MYRLRAGIFSVLTLAGILILFGKSSEAEDKPSTLPPEPTVTYSSEDAKPGETVAHGELIGSIDEAMKQLHAQHHPHGIIESRSIPGDFQVPAMKFVSDFALQKKDLVVINPGGAPPMHTHEGEEAHVLLEGSILYALGDSVFTLEAPYIVNIPPMVPHSFKNMGEDLAELVVIFPTNVWKYDVLNDFPFND
jgi:mannose-6-phosphate isomerase-like protein (cupin superfamily)